MDFLTELTGSVTEATNGIFSDMKTVMMAVLLLQFIPLAVDLILSVIRRGTDDDEESYESYKRNRERKEAFANRYASETKFVGPIKR